MACRAGHRCGGHGAKLPSLRSAHALRAVIAGLKRATCSTDSLDDTNATVPPMVLASLCSAHHTAAACCWNATVSAACCCERLSCVASRWACHGRALALDRALR